MSARPTPDTATYRRLLGLLPTELRRDFGTDMEQLLRDRLREARDASARRALWVQAVADLLAVAAREHASRVNESTRRLLREGTRMEGWIQDLGFGLRSLRRRPGFALAAIVTLALGLGANVSMFSVINGVLLRPLPYPQSEDLVVFWTVNERRDSRDRTVAHTDLRDWQREAPALASIVGHTATRATLTGFGQPEAVFGTRVTDGVLAVFGLTPALGRDLRRDEDVPGGPRTALISHAFWTQRFGADPEVLGRSITLNGSAWEIVGVAPAGFDYPDGSQYWLPRHHDSEGCGRGCRTIAATGRLAPGAMLTTAQEQLDAVTAGLREEFPDTHTNIGTEVEPLIDAMVADIRTGLWILMGAVAMVLLIACANVANLLLVRAADRTGEIALRSALGAGRLRIARQLLAESVVLAVCGGLVGLGIAAAGTSLLVEAAPADAIPRLEEVGIDLGSLIFASVSVVLVTLLFGLFPALRPSGQGLDDALRSGRRSETAGGGSWSRSVLLCGEVALSLTLLLGAGLLLRTMAEITRIDLGFRVENVERFRVSAPEARYDTPEKVIQFFEELDREIEALPGVVAAGHAFGVPFASGSIGTSVELLDRPSVPEPERPGMSITAASPGYLAASGIPLLRGRWLEDADRRETEGVVVINQRVADELYPGEDPIGRQMKFSIGWGWNTDPVRTVVGVVGDVRARALTSDPERRVYFPNAQFGADVQTVTIALSPGVTTAIADVRRVLERIDPLIAVTQVEAMPDVIRREQAPTRFYLTLLSGFSLLALILAGVGLYGVVAYAVSRRTREIGIRIALGARSHEVVRLVLGQGVRPAAAGVALGLAATWFGGKVLAGLLYGVTPHDPLTVVSVIGILALVVLAATTLPARRASRVPPSSALRTD